MTSRLLTLLLCSLCLVVSAQQQQPRRCFTLFGLRAHGEQWISLGGHWQHRCDNGSVTVIACVANARALHQLVDVGANVTINGFWHSCTLNATTQTVRYEAEPSCPLTAGRTLHLDETFRNGQFQMACKDWGYDIVGCWYYPLAGGDAQLMPVNSTREDDLLVHKCEQIEGGRIRYGYEANGCRYNGSTYKVNDTFSSQYVVYKCLPAGAYIGVACKTIIGVELAVGQDLIRNGTVHRCYRRRSQTVYEAYPCHRNGTCDVPPIVDDANTTSSSATLAAIGGGTQRVQTVASVMRTLSSLSSSSSTSTLLQQGGGLGGGNAVFVSGGGAPVLAPIVHTMRTGTTRVTKYCTDAAR